MELILNNRSILIDEIDLPVFQRYKWHINGGYVTHTQHFYPSERTKQIRLHRLILGAKDEEVCDHINRNRLDNRRSNLRLCSVAQNNFNRIKKDNTSGQKGVHFSKSCNKWMARIAANNTRHYLGVFDTKDLAIAAYKKAELIYHGEFRALPA